MNNYKGDFSSAHSIIRFPFSTYNAAGASVTVTNLSNADVQIYKDGSLTQRASAAGIVATVDYDGIIGEHEISIDLQDNTTAGFYQAGSDYVVHVGPFTCDGQTVNCCLGTFSIERGGGALALIKHATYGLSAIKTALDTVATYVDTEVAAVLAAVDTEIANIQSRLPAALVGGRMDVSVGAVATGTLTADALATDAVTEIATAVHDNAMTEAYSTKNGTLTLAQALYELIQQRQEVDTGGGVTETVKKRDQSTTALTLTINNAVIPTSITRAT